MKEERLIEENKGKRIGLMCTIIFHLVVLIVFLLYSINAVVADGNTFMLDFSKQEQIEQEIKQQELKESVAKELDDILSGRQHSQNYRNVAVDRSSKSSRHLKDDRFKNPNQVYDEARELQRKLDASKREALAQQGTDDLPSNNNSKEVKSETYKGPSILSYKLDGRKKAYLPVPAYKAIGGGDVTVRIIVNRKGYVISAQIVESVSTQDSAIREYALQAAKKSRFTASATAPEKQVGEIVYRFIAQ